MDIFHRFIEIISTVENPTIFEFGTCDGQHTNVMCQILKHYGKKFQYHAFEADYRIIQRFWVINDSHKNEIKLNNSAIGNIDGKVKFNLSGGEEKREGHFKQAFYGSSSIRAPKKTLEFWPDMTFEETEVNCCKFDSYIDGKNIENIDFIWADIQGAEGDLIDGGKKALSKTRYLYTEYSNDELYEGEIGLEEILRRLPGDWEIIEDYGSDVLLKNKNIQ